MTRWTGGETDLDRVGHTRPWNRTDGCREEPGERRRDSGCAALEDLEEGKGLNCKRASLGGGKVIYENVVVIGRASPAMACLSNVP